MDHTVYLQLHECLPLPRQRSSDGVSPDWGWGHLIAAYYSLSAPKGWKAESAWLADLQRMVLPCHPSAAGRAQVRGSSPVKDQRSTTVPCMACNQPAEHTTNQHKGIKYRIHNNTIKYKRIKKARDTYIVRGADVCWVLIQVLIQLT